MSQSPFDLTRQNSDIDSRIVAGLERLSEVFRVLLWQAGTTHGLSPIQIQVLIFLLHHIPNRGKVSYLAREFNMTKATISDAVKVLVSKGLVEKVPDSGDSRSHTLFLTSQGRKIAKSTSTFTAPLQNAVERLPKIEKEFMMRNLMTLIHQLHHKGLITVQRMCLDCHFYQVIGGGHDPYCQLLQKDLPLRELRLDCPEFEVQQSDETKK